jgi:class 3 adenylate cyclase
MDDTRVVLDAVGSSSAHVVCHGGSTFLGMLFAATHPRRTETLSIIGGWSRILEADDYPIGIPAAMVEHFIEQDCASWGTPDHPPRWAPSRAHDEAFCKRMARFERVSSPPTAQRTRFHWVVQLDVRAALSSIRVPTLVIHRERDVMTPMVHGRYIAEQIQGARFVALPGRDHWLFTENADEIFDHIEELITGVAPAGVPDRALATVLFTDIVGSTEQAARLGDRHWAKVLDEHDAVSDRELDRFRGRKVNPTGDGLLATFDGPARAVRCAQAIRDAVRPLGIEVRAGLHVGEVELRGNDIGGIAVHIGQRVTSVASPGEVLVSRTVIDLVTGSGIEFDERGEHELKGVPGTWKLFAVRG